MVKLMSRSVSKTKMLSLELVLAACCHHAQFPEIGFAKYKMLTFTFCSVAACI